MNLYKLSHHPVGNIIIKVLDYTNVFKLLLTCLLEFWLYVSQLIQHRRTHTKSLTSSQQALILSAPIGAVGMFSALLCGWYSDRSVSGFISDIDSVERDADLVRANACYRSC